MYILKNSERYTSVVEYANKKLIIGIDSSKTDSCMQVADEYGNRLDYYEFLGLPEDDVLIQAAWIRSELRIILADSNIVLVGIEDIITKKYNGKFSNGLEVHQSRFKITAIFMSFIMAFQDYFNVLPELVNNWTWKSSVLPEKYRTTAHDKGSLDWHRDRGTKLGLTNDNVTDADCILEFLLMKHKISKDVKISDALETTRHKNIVRLFSSGTDVVGIKQFVDNSNISLEGKVAFISNRLAVKEMACCLVDINIFTPKQIYTLCNGKFKTVEKELFLCVRRIE